MAEYIEREAVLNVLNEELEFETSMYTAEQNKLINTGLKIAVRDIKHQPSADAVEVVRCERCRFYQAAQSSLIGEVMCCTGQGDVLIQKEPNDFCSRGERRADGVCKES